MKRTAILAVIVLSALSVVAQIPQKFNYQAIIRGNAGRVIAGKPLGLRFSIRDGSATGTVQYSETQLTTSNTYGLVNVQVGAGTVVTGTFAAVTWGTGNKFLQVEVDTTGSAGYVELSTVELVGVPYALQSERAAVTDSAGVAGNAKLADSAVAAGKAKLADSTSVAGHAKLADSAAAAGKAKLADSATAAGKAKLADSSRITGSVPAGLVVRSVNGLKDDVVLTGGGGTSLSASGNTITVNGALGTITGVTAGSGLIGGGTSGVVALGANFGGNGAAATVSRSDHTHVGQFWTSSSGNTLTLQTSSPSFNSSALELDVTNTSSQAAALFAQTLSTNSNSAAVVGQASGNGGAAGVLGIALGSNTYAFLGSAQGSGSYAGVFSGNVVVTGTLSKGAGSFRIDHPLDPANKYLSHSFVESPDMMNIYDGNVVLDGNGEATITMPDWFEALNMDFRYQLTAMGKPSPGLYIAAEISGNQFRIAGGTPRAKVSWMVTGIRHDAYANAHRIPVEETKPPSEKGKYLNPQELGMPAQQGIYSVTPMTRQRVAVPAAVGTKLNK